MITETFYDVMRPQGITPHSFPEYCSLTASTLGLGSTPAPQIGDTMENKSHVPVLWLDCPEISPRGCQY